MSSTNRSDDNETSLNNKPTAESTATTSQSRRAFLGKVTAASVATGLVGLATFEGSAQLKIPADDSGGGAAPACPAGCEEGPIQGQTRANTAHQRRISAADYEYNMPIPSHPCNNDEATFGSAVNFFASYSKGMPHPSVFGEVDPNAYCTYKRALASGRPSDFELIPLGCGTCDSSTQTPSATTSQSESRATMPEYIGAPITRNLFSWVSRWQFSCYRITDLLTTKTSPGLA